MSYVGTTPTFSEIQLKPGQIVYFGDKDTDGSFRIFLDGTDLKTQIRALGVWEDKDVIEP
jgi:hypothetical protein